MLYVVRTGVQWEYLPVDLGNPDAVARTWQRWAQAGVFRRAFGGLFPPCDRNLAAVSIDGMYIPVALESHGARAAPEGAHDCPRPDKGCVGQPPLYCPVHQAIGAPDLPVNEPGFDGGRHRPDYRLADPAGELP